MRFVEDSGGDPSDSYRKLQMSKSFWSSFAPPIHLKAPKLERIFVKSSRAAAVERWALDKESRAAEARRTPVEGCRR